jgi:hypothetical protein
VGKVVGWVNLWDEMDNMIAERALRPVAVGRRYALYIECLDC